MKKFWAHGFHTLFELLIEMPKNGIPWHRIQCEGMEQIEATLAKGKGALIYAPHTGNFFWAYAFLSERYACQTVVTGKSAELSPLYQLFAARGYQGYDYDEVPPIQLYQSLRRHLNMNGVVFILGDFYRSNFRQCELFGMPNRAPEGAAELSVRLDTPLLPMEIWREDSGEHHMKIYEALKFEENGSRLQQCQDRLEGAIYRNPAQWLYWFQLPQRWMEFELKQG